MVVERRVIDHRPHAQSRAGVGARREFASQPADGVSLELFVSRVMPAPVCGYYLGKVVAARHLLEGHQALANNDLGDDVAVGRGRQTVGDEPLHDRWHRSTVGTSSGREVPHQLRIQTSGLSAGSLQAAVGRQVRVSGDQLALEGDRTDHEEKERLARSVLTDREADRRAAVGDAVDIFK